jgi:N-acetylmuramoyl-L-alanine amidase
VIDPGHGGENRGAWGQKLGRWEKELTLIMARLVAEEIKVLMPGAKIVLTRKRDRGLSLAQRGQIANSLGADLFLSVHYNACENHSQRGYETYFLPAAHFRRETDRMALEQRWRLPASIASEPQAGSGREDTSEIVAQLRRQGVHAQSYLLADKVQRALRRLRGKKGDRGVRQAPFDVLYGLKMAGALVELGFIDHAQEGPELANPIGQRAMARSLAQSLADYWAQTTEKSISQN